MYLKRIELNGFKSFNNKKEFIIKNGITGIVGPNGSGKSNIADAIRWVLGEQSSKNLRGAHMEDVIFNGSQELAQKGYCDVALVFDNADMRVRCEYTEIVVRRKMYRSGESEYSINNTLCRLKDVLDLFRDTGIGKEGYSIIGQGKIDEILNNKAVARRKVFEEAAGIMKYRVRKEDAERNLEKTHENLVRLEDIIGELSVQLEPLEKQMTEAKKYVSLRDRLKHLEVNLYLYNQERSVERIEKLDIQLAENEQDQKDTAARLEALSAMLSACKTEYQDLQGEIEKHNSMIAGYGSEQEKLRGELNVLFEREKNITQRLEELRLQEQDASGNIQTGNEKIEEINAGIEQLNSLIDEKFAAIDQMRDECAHMVSGSGSIAEKYEELKESTTLLRDEIENAKREIGEKNVLLSMLEQKKEDMLQEYQKSKDSITDFEAQKSKAQEELAGFKAANARSLKLHNELLMQIKEMIAVKEKTGSELLESRQHLSQLISNKKLLSEIKDGYEGYQASVKSLFQSAKEEPAIQRKLIGTFADIVEVPQQYETAIETVLGNALQNVVVEREEDAKEIVEYLRKNRLGRVTFLPLNALGVKHLTPEEKKGFGREVLCVASEVIQCDEALRPAVDFMLARTVIVEDMDSAIAVMRRTGYAFRTVTLKGDIFRPGGTITGGSVDPRQTGLLSRNRMISEYGDKIITKEKSVASLSSSYEELQKKVQKKDTEREVLLNEMREHELSITRISQLLSGIEEQLCNAQTKYEALSVQHTETGTQIDETSGFIQKSVLTLEELQQTYDGLLKELEEAESAITRDAELLAQKREALAKEEMAQNELTSRKNVLLNDLSHFRNDLFDRKIRIEQAQTQRGTLENELSSLVLPKKDFIQSQLNELTLKIKNAGTLAQEQYARREQLINTQRTIEKEIEEKNTLKSDLIEQKYKIIASKEKIELVRESLQNKIWDDYGLTYANAEKLRGEFSYQNGTREIDEIKEHIQEMGAVNPNAIEDYARVNDRLNSLTIQKNDLIKAGDDLQIVIQSLLRDMKKCFLEKFELINKNFSEVFKQLFGGGNASVTLIADNNEDIMESGIEIIAEPPGKKLQNINLLSGGEKALTAISLIFAMLNINPSPICLLDEIDAPLDEANVVRFSEYLKALSTGLQFIVITHRKPTMAACDSLYGIAMHQKGVSEIVSVKLS